MDVVGYSKTLIDDQRQVLRDLNEIVQATDQFQGAEAEKKLICLATGDGMALAFFTSPSAPVRCAIEITRALRALPHVKVRMGIHSGPVSRMDDVNKSANIAGGGINMAQRVMDCGDAGHILLSQRVAEDLAQFREWNAAVHDLGESEVKHGTKLHLFNFFGDGFGNPAVPSKLGGATRSRSAVGTAKLRRLVPIILAAAVAAIVTMVMAIHYFRSHEKPGLRSSSVISTKSIAVLPFENLSHDPDNAYFADGIQEEILTRLSKIGDLKVISRTSTQRYKSSPANLLEIAQQLGVAHILEGSVQRSADQVRVNVQLINAQTDSHLWADNFDRKLTDIFAVESEIAGKIAGTLQARLTGPEQRAIAAHPTENSEAHQRYLKGRYFWHKRTEEGLKKSIAYFNQAIEKDPRYALAYSGLGDSYMYMLRLGYLHGLHPKEAYLRAQAAATKALEIDDNLAEAHTSLALIKMEYEWDWAGSERSFQRAIQLNPRLDEAHHQYSHYLMSMGRTRESLAESFAPWNSTHCRYR